MLLHYDDATLKELYFLDPQWLCDMLAHVVTIREINPFARTGKLWYLIVCAEGFLEPSLTFDFDHCRYNETRRLETRVQIIDVEFDERSELHR